MSLGNLDIGRKRHASIATPQGKAGTSFANDIVEGRNHTYDEALVHWELIGQTQFFAAFIEDRASCLIKKTINRSGKAGYIIAWLLGVRIAILLLVFLRRGRN